VTSFRFECHRTLLKALGRFDAICGYATLAVDLLDEQIQQNPDPRYIQMLWMRK
jgi:hypothetical protein